MTCRSCHFPVCLPILDLGTQKLSDFVDPGQTTASFPLGLMVCQQCSLVQLVTSTPPEKLYTNHYGYRSGMNATMRDELKEIVHQATTRHPVSAGDIVVDIGANDGTLLSFYDWKQRSVGFEPVEKLAILAEKHGKIFNDFFSHKVFTKAFGNQKASIITAISMFYDLEDPNTFVEDLKDILAPDGLLIIQQNYLLSMMDQCAFDNIVHEHVEYYSLQALEHLLHRHGLEVVDVEESPINGGSFRTYIQHMTPLHLMRWKEDQRHLKDLETYNTFADSVGTAITNLTLFIAQQRSEGKTIALLGASTRGNTIIQACGMTPENICYAVERNPEKWGKVIASCGIPIVSEEQFRKDRPDYAIVLPWFFKDEIVQREQDYVNAGGALVFPLPTLEVVRKSQS